MATATLKKESKETKAFRWKDLGLSNAKVLELYRQMLLIRRFEERSAQEYGKSKIGGFCHLYIGQEAVGVGAIAALRDDDYIFSAYRDHGHAIARGMDPKGIMAELFGKFTGCSRGWADRCTCSTLRKASWAVTVSSEAMFLLRPELRSPRNISAETP